MLSEFWLDSAFLKTLRLLFGCFVTVVLGDPRLEELRIDHGRAVGDPTVPMIRVLFNGSPIMGHYVPICKYYSVQSGCFVFVSVKLANICSLT